MGIPLYSFSRFNGVTSLEVRKMNHDGCILIIFDYFRNMNMSHIEPRVIPDACPPYLVTMRSDLRHVDKIQNPR